MITELLPGAKRGQDKEPGEGAASETNNTQAELQMCEHTQRGDHHINIVNSACHCNQKQNAHIFLAWETCQEQAFPVQQISKKNYRFTNKHAENALINVYSNSKEKIS